MDADPALVETLRRLEEELLRPEVRASRAQLEARLAADFVEISRSSRVYDREAIVEALVAEANAGGDGGPVRVEGFAVRVLAPGIALATFRTVGDGPAGAEGAWRSSIWRQEGDAWRMAFHQGTPAR